MLFFKLSSFYFFYFALLGVIAPYLSLYMQAQGFTLFQIAQLMALLMLTKVLAPNLWGAMADRYENRLILVRSGALVTLFCFVGFFFAELFWHYALVVFLFSFFWNAVLPQFEVITLFNLGTHRDRYSRIRLWGSIGFIASVIWAGWIFDVFSIDWFPWILLGIIFFIWLSSLFGFAEPAPLRKKDNQESFGTQLFRKNVVVFFFACFLLHLSHGAYYTYFSIYMESIGYGKTAIGFLWSLGVLAEVLLFIVMHTWFARQSVKQIMVIALALTAVRWVLIALLADSLVWLLIAQCLHAMSFGAMHAASIKFVHDVFDACNHGRAQAMYSSLGFGAGGAAGAFLSGLVVDAGSYAQAFLFSAVIAFTASILMQWKLHDPKVPKPAP